MSDQGQDAKRNRDSNLPTGPRLGRIAGNLDAIALQLETMTEAQIAADGEMPGTVAVRLLSLQHGVLEAHRRAILAVEAVNRPPQAAS
jgi:hypothetical protein